MITLKLRPDIFQGHTPGKSIQTAALESGISYPTFFAMVKGKWNSTCLAMLGRYLTTLGFTEESLKATPFGSIFIVRDYDND